jgi:Holliday junction resolvase
MGGKFSRDKGARFERDLVNTFKAYGHDAQRIPLSGMTEFAKNDIQATVMGKELNIEAKKKAAGFKSIYGYLEKDCADAVILGADRKPALIVFNLKEWLDWVDTLTELVTSKTEGELVG